MAYTGTTFLASTGNPSTFVDDGTTPSGAAETLRTDTSLTKSTSLADISSYRNLDVTEQIRRYNDLYGGSDNTQQGGLAASKSLNYAHSPTIQQATVISATAIPFTYKFEGQVGLFGAENIYYAMNIDIKNILNANPAVEVGAYKEATIDLARDLTTGGPPGFYEPANFVASADPPPPTPPPGGCIDYVFKPNEFTEIHRTNCYQPALISNIFPPYYDPLISVRLDNIGVGNIYIDTWLDTMIYTRTQKMWGFDKIYVRPKDLLYFGFHARNTRHLPYNVHVTIGEEVINSTAITERYLVDES